MRNQSRHHRSDLNDIARRAMREKGLDPDFPRDALEQLERIDARLDRGGGRGQAMYIPPFTCSVAPVM